ncbi:hypothetical protein E2C01_041297 [Portunus trituberculatus]|uniref:Uncharacterized protein n=1 Tax=Portunus trituberculatus TaxID=210409 RepID=A0A5B7FRJ4_PORTR|nr:hypothetical protein [Portunus trituberculatus]
MVTTARQVRQSPVLSLSPRPTYAPPLTPCLLPRLLQVVPLVKEATGERPRCVWAGRGGAAASRVLGDSVAPPPA